MVRVAGFVQPGDYLLLRFEDRLMWVYVAEMGNAYIYFCIKVRQVHTIDCVIPMRLSSTVN